MFQKGLQYDRRNNLLNVSLPRRFRSPTFAARPSPHGQASLLRLSKHIADDFLQRIARNQILPDDLFLTNEASSQRAAYSGTRGVMCRSTNSCIRLPIAPEAVVSSEFPTAAASTIQG